MRDSRDARAVIAGGAGAIGVASIWSSTADSWWHDCGQAVSRLRPAPADANTCSGSYTGD